MASTQTTNDYYRFCPGQERIKISNPICRGRRAIRFPKCRGCQFNDDEKNATQQIPTGPNAAAATPPTMESIFLPHAIRGAVPEPLSQDAAWRIGHATAQFLRGRLRGLDRANPNARSIIVGRDMRTHSTDLQQALTNGLRSTGIDVINIGMIDTPQLYFAVNHIGACGGIQTTGGKDTADYNGFKICGSKGLPISIDTGLASIRDIAVRVPKHQTGTTARLSQQDIAQPYADHILSFLRGENRLPRPLKIVVDAGNGMAGRWIPLIFKSVKRLRIIPLNFKHDGTFAHAPDTTNTKHLRELRKAVRHHGADLGVAFNGDADACVFVDERGLTVPPDVIATLLARAFVEREPGAIIVHDLRSTRCLPDEIERAGGASIRERVGHPTMKKTMTERNASFGSDLDGRFYFRDGFFCESPLLAFVHTMNLLIDTGQKLGELVRSVQRYKASGILSYRCENLDETLETLSSAHPDAKTDDLDGIMFSYPDWWFNIRPDHAASRLEVTLEARTKKLVDQRLAELTPLLGKRLRS